MNRDEADQPALHLKSRCLLFASKSALHFKGWYFITIVGGKNSNCCLDCDNFRCIHWFWLSAWTFRHFYIELLININMIAAEKDIHSLKAVCKKCFDVKILRKQKTSKIFLCKCISNLFKKINVKFHVYMKQTFKIMSNSLPPT